MAFAKEKTVFQERLTVSLKNKLTAEFAKERNAT